jgi:hypothetical protein
MKKWSYIINFGICAACIIVFLVFRKSNQGGAFAFLGLAAATLLNGIYEMIKTNKAQKVSSKE